MNTWEKDFIAEVRARVLAKQPVSAREKQIVLDLVRQEGVAIKQQVIDRARNEGLDTSGILAV